MQKAKLDLGKAIQATENLSHNISSENLATLREYIKNLIHEDANIRSNSLKVITEIKIKTNEEKPLTSGKTFTKFWPYAAFFLTGIAAWSILPLILFITKGAVSAGGSISTIVAVISGILFFYFSCLH